MSQVVQNTHSTSVNSSQPGANGNILSLNTTPTTSLSESLWTRAYEDLKKKEPVVTLAFEQYCRPASTTTSSTTDTFSNPDQIAQFVQSKLDKRECERLVLNLFGKPVKLREQSEKLVRFILWSKDFVSVVLKSEPHAAIAWAGISLIMPASRALRSARYESWTDLVNSYS